MSSAEDADKGRAADRPAAAAAAAAAEDDSVDTSALDSDDSEKERRMKRRKTRTTARRTAPAAARRRADLRPAAGGDDDGASSDGEDASAVAGLRVVFTVRARQERRGGHEGRAAGSISSRQRPAATATPGHVSLRQAEGRGASRGACRRQGRVVAFCFPPGHDDTAAPCSHCTACRRVFPHARWAPP